MDRRTHWPQDSGEVHRPADALTRVSHVTAALATLIAASVLAGWLLGVTWLTTWGGKIPAAPEYAVAGILVAAAVVAPRRVTRVCAALAALLAVRTFALYVTGAEPLWSWSGAAGEGMALHTAVALLVLAAAELVPARHRRVAADTAAALVLVLAGAGLLGYLYGRSELYALGPSGSPMSLPVVVMLLLLAGSLGARSPQGIAPWLVHGTDAGAVLMRRQLPVVLVAVPLLGWLVLRGEAADWYGPALAEALTVVGAVALLLGATLYTARLLAHTDERRHRAHTALTWVNADLAERIQSRAEELEAERSRTEVLADRQRIAADMHDHVIQGLFAVELRLNAAARNGPGAELLHEAVHGIDEAIRELRSAIFELKHPATSGTIEARLRKLADNAGHTVPTSFVSEGSLDLVDDTTAEQLVAAAREALSNAVRHARASSIEVALRVQEEWLVLTVTDDGAGLGPDDRTPSGMRNIRHRAERLDGSCTWSVPPGGGTTVTWRVPCRTSTPPREAAVESTEPRTLLSGSLATALLECARALATCPPHTVLAEVGGVVERFLGADHVSVGAAATDDKIRLLLATGMPPGVDAVGALAPREATLSGYVMSTGEALKIDNLAELPTSLRMFGRLPFGAAVMTPVGEPAYATLVLARVTGSEPFTREELRDAGILSGYVGLAMERAGLVPDPEVVRRPASLDVPAAPPRQRVAPGESGPAGADEDTDQVHHWVSSE